MFSAFMNCYRQVKVAYSVKNCFIPQIIRILEKSHSPLYEVSSLGEMKLLQKMNINLDRCIFTSIYKSESALEFAIQNNLGLYAIDSFLDLFRLKEFCKKLDVRAKVLIRVNPAFNMKDTIFASSVPWSKTGVEICKGNVDCAESLFREAAKSSNLMVAGLHGHLGSQVTNLEYYKRFSKILIDFYEEMNRKGNISMDIVDFGGGYPVKYHKNVPQIEEIAQVITKPLEKLRSKPLLIIESGRYLISNAGILVTKVVGLKWSAYAGKIAIVDASMYNHLLDSILVNWYFDVEVATCPLKEKVRKREKIHVVGVTNDSLDHLDSPTETICPKCGYTIRRKRKRILPELREGDVLMILNAGAYTTCFNNNYCLLPRSEILVLGKDGTVKIARKRGTYEDVFVSLAF